MKQTHPRHRSIKITLEFKNINEDCSFINIYMVNWDSEKEEKGGHVS